jgi:hypothetical protein
LPDTFEALSGQSALLGYSISLMFMGVIIVMFLEKVATKSTK